MSKHPLVRVIERDGDEEYRYVMSRQEAEGEADLEITDERPTLAEMAEYLDQELESENYHSLVGVNSALDGLLKDAGATEELRERFLVALVEAGGLLNASR